MTENREVGDHHFRPRCRLIGLAVLLVVATTAAGADRPTQYDNLTFRPTVLIRKGPAQGSGTVIASVDNETLILTAAHVLDGPGELTVELHRFNLGLEHKQSRVAWPRKVPAEIVVTDKAADVGIIRIRRMTALPYVARLAGPEVTLTRGRVVTSVGIDGGANLNSWTTYVVAVAPFEMDGNHDERPFVVTIRPPEHGRSGGGLFLEDGRLVGVCVGRVQIYEGRRSGFFASNESILRLIRDHDLDASVTRSARHPAVSPTRAGPAQRED
jgi:S1-C subfamily serine protease